MSQEPLDASWDDYLVVIREDAHQLLAWAYLDTRNELPRARDEYDVTGLLGAAMENRIKDPGTPERFMYYVVRPEHPVSPSGEQGKDRPKLDVQIVRCGRPQRYFTFEAKRLRDDAQASASDSVGQYLGDQGVGRFVSGRYAAESVEAAMIGCVEARDGLFWLDRVGVAFRDDVQSGKNRFRIVEQLRRETVIPELPEEAVSVHARAGTVPIRLFHILIRCR